MPTPIEITLRDRQKDAFLRHRWAVTHLKERFVSVLDNVFSPEIPLSAQQNSQIVSACPHQKQLELCLEHRLHLFPLLTGDQYVWIAACIEERTEAELEALKAHQARVPTEEEQENISTFFKEVFGEECPHVPLVLDMS